MSKLAILGGSKVRTKPFPKYNTIGEEEKKAVIEVMDSGVLSGFLGTWSPEFLGGKYVQRLEREWEVYFNIKHAVSVNSATTGLYAAVGAAGIGPGDEVIVSPYTMTASSACVLIYNAIPVFADILPDNFCLDPNAIRRSITPRTKAIVVVDLLGHPFEADEIMAIAREHNLIVIEDAAQAYGANYHGRPAGTLADIGVFSLNVHKTINTGEGGVCVTNNDEFAERMRLIRNHAEEVVEGKKTKNIINMIGYNHRMGEIEAVIASEQLKKVDSLVAARIENAEYLTKGLHSFTGITPPIVKQEIRHGYYSYPVRYDASLIGISRDLFVSALRAEGIPTSIGYVKPIYLQPVYQQRIAYGADGCPFSCQYNKESKVSYKKGICPVAERMYHEEFIAHGAVYKGISKPDLDDVVNAYKKVLSSASALSLHFNNVKV